MEGMSGWVGPTYEIAQPRLRITAGSLMLGDVSSTLVGGSLWHDRQTYNFPTAPPPAGGGTAAMSSRRQAALHRQLDGPLVPSGVSANVNAVWPEATSSAGSGIRAGRSTRHGRPSEGSGNLYFADGLDRYNGGAFLQRRGRQHGAVDYDINIFDPADPADSPHWQVR